MSIFNNSDLNYNYDGNGVDINNFEDPDYSITEKIEVRNCRGCNKEFEVRVAYDKNGSVVFFVSKYCTECNIKMKINNNVCVSSNDSTWGSVNIDIANVPQNRVEGLVNDLSALSVGIEESCKEFQSFKKHIEHDIEEKEFEFDIHKNVTEQVIKNNKLDLDVFKSAQTYFNEDQIGINLAHFTLIKEIHKTLIIGFSVLVVFMLVTWGYLTYTFFNH